MTVNLTPHLLTCLLLAAGCGSSVRAPPDPCSPPPSYRNDLLPAFVRAKCVPCHADFDVMVPPSSRAQLVDDVTSGRQPPPSSMIKTSTADRALAELWRTCGYPP